MNKHTVTCIEYEKEVKADYQQNFPVDNNWQFVFWPKCFHRVSLLMYGIWRKVKMGRWYIVFWQHLNICFSVVLRVKKENVKQIFIDVKKPILSNKDNFIVIKIYFTDYCKLLLNQVGSYVLCGKYEFLCSHFLVVTWLRNCDHEIKPLVLSAWPYWWKSCGQLLKKVFSH